VEKLTIQRLLKTILNNILHNGAKPYIVGGVIRDSLLNISYNYDSDYDIEVYNISLPNLEKLLSNYGSVQSVGKSFGVLKLNIKDNEKILHLDFSLPRTENKIGVGHTGFEITTNPHLTTFEASKRRDFTINSIMYDFKNDKFIDHFGGINDIKSKTLRYVDECSFIEDPLRVYRAIGFSARFGFELEEKTFILCKNLLSNLKELPKERVWEEFKNYF
jgi:tRNA nucleotidyltransferase (CCA-adding enzyme)